MTSEINSGWNSNKADDEEKLYKRHHATTRLVGQQRAQENDRDARAICRLLADLLYVDAHEFNITLGDPSTSTYRMGRIKQQPQKPPCYDGNGDETPEFKYFRQQRDMFYSSIMHYAMFCRYDPWGEGMPKYNSTEARSLVGLYTLNIIVQGFKRAPAAFDVGSSLYLYQQLHDRKLCELPALSKAAWLVKNAPMNADSVGERPRGEWKRIQEYWKHHFEWSHLWAAIVTTTGSPLCFSEDLLFNFICNVDLGKFNKFAYTFLDFRQRVRPPKVSGHTQMYLKQGLTQSKIDRTKLLDLREIPCLLDDFQWDLSRYPRKVL
jgi:hypothetical protein